MKQRRWKQLAAALALSLSLTACAGVQASPEPPSGGGADLENGESFFSAEVQETGERTFLARVTDSGNCALPADSAVQVSREVLSADGCPTLTPGQPVRVVFNGEVLETDPLQLGRVFAVYRMDSEGHCVTSAGVTDFAPLPHGITLTAEAVTPTSLTLVCQRDEAGGEELWTDSRFVVERLDEATGHWSEVLHRYLHEPLVWDDMAYRVPADAAVEWELDWEALYGPLPAGIYRVVKTIFTMDDEASICCAGFSIPD